jgi:selenocysteine lyase/cysteine desulfurase
MRQDFPILAREVHGYQLAYLDSGNTSQKPRSVVEAVSKHYLEHNANVARAMHQLGVEATGAYEGARLKVAEFIGANPEEIVFTKNASEALNLAAHTLTAKLGPGDEVVISVMEHHSNIVPWQLAAERRGFTLRWFDVTAEGRLDIEAARESKLINERTKVVSLTWVSNVTGVVNPISEVGAWAHSVGAIMVVDGSQGVPHLPVVGLIPNSSSGGSLSSSSGGSLSSSSGGSLSSSSCASEAQSQDLTKNGAASCVGDPIRRSAPRDRGGDCVPLRSASSAQDDVARLSQIDMLAFTGHKMLGPTGIGVLWGRYDLLETLPPFLGGGEMIEVVRMEGSTYAPPPARFEAGTPPIAQAVGLGAAIDYLSAIGMDQIAAYEHRLVEYALERLGAVQGLRILGPLDAKDRSGAFSFTLKTPSGLDVHPHDVMQLLDGKGIAVRGGHHCARPLHERFSVQSSNRASLYLYNTEAEIDRLAEGLDYVRDFFEKVK